MNTEPAMQSRNQDSAILFMQQDHANTLKGLHEEIASLQKKCTDLTFQLTMHGLTIDEPDAVDTQIQQVHKELALSKEKIALLESGVAERDKKVERLESDAKTQRKRWLEESRTHSQTTNALRAELEAKANNIAYLTTELHRLKQRSKNNEPGSSPLAQASQNVSIYPNTGLPSQPAYLHPDSAQAAKRNQTHHHYIPAPPQRDRTLGPGSGSGASRLRRMAGQKSSHGSGSAGSKPMLAVHPSSADVLIGRQVNPLTLSAGNRSSGSESPDITPFIPPAKEEIQLDVRQVLPPIPMGSSSSPNGGAKPVLVHQVVSSTAQKKTRPSSSDAAIVTLAVSNPVPDNAWSLPQEHRSSEYN